MRIRFLALVIASIPSAGASEWKRGDDMDAFHFDTGDFVGVFVADDKRELGRTYALHGLRHLSYKGHDLNAPENEAGTKRRHQGHLNLYRVYGASETFGSLRDEHAHVEHLEDGARLTWEATEERPARFVATWRISPPAQIDVTIEATATRAIKNFEVLPATYVPHGILKGIYLEEEGKPALTTFRPEPGRHEAYEFYPHGEKARDAQENTGRIHSSWKWPTELREEVAALPIVFGGNDDFHIIQFASPGETSGVCTTPTPESGDPNTDWTNVEKHSALYFSLFGRDVEAGETVVARIRQLVIDTPEDPAKVHRELYEKFLAETGD